MNLLTLPLRNLSAQKARTTLTVVGIAVAVAGFVALTGLTRGLQNAYEQGLGDVGGDMIVSQRGAYSLVNGSLAEDIGPTLTAVPGVDKAAGVLLSIAEVDEQANIFIAGWPDGSFLWNSLKFKAGAPPSGDRDLVLGESMAGALGKTVGDEIEVQYDRFRISGISEPDSVFNQNIAIMRHNPMQTFIGRPNSVSLFQIQLRRPIDPAATGAVVAGLQAVSPDVTVGSSAEFAGNMQFVKTIEAIATAVSLVMLVASSILVANTLLMAVSERVQEFGILAALGWTPLRIRVLVVTEGFLMSLFGSVVGVGLGVLAEHLVSSLRITTGLLEPYVTPGLIAEAVIWIAVLGPTAALYPAWRATMASPSTAIRGIR